MLKMVFNTFHSYVLLKRLHLQNNLLVRWLLLTSHWNKRETKINGKIMLNSPRQNFTRDKNHIIYTRETNDDGMFAIYRTNTITKKYVSLFARKIGKPLCALHCYAWNLH